MDVVLADSHLPDDALGDDTSIPTESLSDGRDWVADVVATEIQAEMAKGVLAAYEIGRRLLWAKRTLGHGGFLAFCTDRLGLSSGMRARSTQLAAFLLKHPKLLSQLQGASVKKVLLLTSLPADDLQRLMDGDPVGTVTLTDLAEVPYHELKVQLEKVKHDRDEALAREAEVREDLVNTKLRVADLTDPHRQARERWAATQKELDEGLLLIQRGLTKLAGVQDATQAVYRSDLDELAEGRAGVLPPDLRHNLALIMGQVAHLGAHITERWLLLVGDELGCAAYVQAVERARNGGLLPSHLRPLEGDILPTFDEVLPPTGAQVLNLGSGTPRPKGR